MPALVQRRRHLVTEACIVGAGEKAVKSHVLLPPIIAGLGQQRLGLGQMQALDHAPVEGNHALAGIFRQREGGDDGVRLGHRLFASGEKALLAGSIWAGWISVLPSKPIAAASSHSRAKPLGIAESR